MTLYISNNIRKLRREKDMTQEQLAEQLGVSSQAVSRWENGTTYPDMELIPVIADFFGVSTDRLFGIPEEKKENEALDTINKLDDAIYEQPFDPDKICDLLREIRRNHLNSSHIDWLWGMSKFDCFCHEKILPEMRLTAQAFLAKSQDMRARGNAIRKMSLIENDDRLEEFFRMYSSEEDLSKEKLLRARYRKRKEWEKYEPLRQKHLFNVFDELLIFRAAWLNPGKKEIIQDKLQFCRLKSDLLRLICGQNDETDCFAYHRLWMGLEYSAVLAGAGQKEEALNVLEDTVAVLEKVMQITDEQLLGCSSPWLGDQLGLMAKESYAYPFFDESRGSERVIKIYYRENKENGRLYTQIVPSEIIDYLCYRRDLKQWFYTIRDDLRFISCLDRVKSLVVKEKD